MVPAAAAAAAFGVAFIGVPVAEAAPAGGEAPVTRQTAVTLASGGPGDAGALTRQLVAERVQGALGVAVARCKREENTRRSVLRLTHSQARQLGLSPLQPLGPNWKVAGAQLSQFLPTTLGRHRHWPPLGSHTVLREP